MERTVSDLVEMQSYPLEIKIEMTKDRIIEWADRWGKNNIYVSISGGKDSQVLAHIAKSIYPDIKLVFVNTGLEWDSVRKKGIEMADEVLRPEMDFVSVIKRFGYPVISKEVSQCIYDIRIQAKTNGIPIEETNLYHRNFSPDSEYLKKFPKYSKQKYEYLLHAPFRVSQKCCDKTKKHPAKVYEKKYGSKPIIGTLAEESRLRKVKWVKVGCNAFDDKRPTSQPMSFWKEQDVLKYIKINNIDLASIYGDVVYSDSDGMTYQEDFFNMGLDLKTTGVNRTGCVFCLFGIAQDKDKFLKLKETEPMKYDYVMRGGKFDDEGLWIPDKGLGYKFVIDWLNEHGNLNIKY